MKEPTPESFGDRLALIRKDRALTQEDLGRRAGISRRMIAYYERSDAYPPGPLLADFARALRVSTDELLALKPVKVKPDPKAIRLMNRLKKVERFPPADQRAVLKFIDALAERHARNNGK